MQTSILKPGLLVSLKTSVHGGVSYQRIDLEAKRRDGSSAVSKWETTRVIHDPEEFERALAARAKARQIISAVCCPTSFGLLCPFDKEAEFRDAIEAARKCAEEFNVSAHASRVTMWRPPRP